MAAPMSHAVKFCYANQLRNVSKVVLSSRNHVRQLSAVTNHYLNTLQEPRLASICQKFTNFDRSRPQFRFYSGPTAEQPEANQAKDQSQTPNDAEPEESDAEKKLSEENTKLAEQLKELEDKYKRSLAETENVRLRMKKQVDDSKLFAIQGFCKDLLDVADVLQKATESVPTEELEKGNQHLKGLYDGLVMTEKELQRVFTRNGLVKIDPVDEKFDPNCHEAIFYQPFPGKEPGHVAVVTKIGYKLHSRTIRPAVVGVVKEG